MQKKVLYISYDGMTDPLGQSQVLPYLAGLSKEGYQFTILSFEKKDRFARNKELIEGLCKSAGISWIPLSFTSKPPMLSKFYDTIRMRQKAFQLQRKERFDMVHCRSYIAADIGLRLKRAFGVKFFFDMRGFWADEKRDGGAWKDNHPVFKRVYKYYKQKEKEYLREADHIISLTEAGRNEMRNWEAYSEKVPISVIPCCADMQHFALRSSSEKSEGRKALGIQEDRMVVSYLGSVGAWYMLDEMLEFFVALKANYANALFLFISHSDPNYIRQKAGQHGISPDDLVITEAQRKEVPIYMKASDFTLFFIRPVYSKLSSSPTKLGEVLSMGIPVIANSGVGDVEEIIRETKSGVVISEFNKEAYGNAISQIPDLLNLDPTSIREKAAKYFDLNSGIEMYRRAYAKVFENPGS